MRAIFTIVPMLILMLAFVEFMSEEAMFPGITFGNVNTVIAAIVVMVLVNIAASQTIKNEEKKYRTEDGMLCPACKDKTAVEKEQNAALARSESERWQAELKGMMEKDPELRSMVQEWRSVNGDSVPGRGLVAEFQNAMNLEQAGNYEVAAQVYEKHKLWSLAGKARVKARVQTVKHVTVDMNQLIEQIGSKGLAIPYRCHNCGANITIDKNSNVSGLKFCSYCGTAYNIEDMSTIIQEALAG